jgi:hypothetical protein
LVGSLIGAERWRRVVPGEATLRVVPSPHGLTLSLTARF